MISIEMMKQRAKEMVGREFPLVFWRGKARVAAVDDVSIALLVRGQRVDLTWDRLSVTWQRLLDNFTLTVDELGGQADGVGIVSLFAFMRADVVDVLDGDGLLVVSRWSPARRSGVDVLDADGLLVLSRGEGKPVHQYVDVDRRSTWGPWRRKIHGD